MLENGDMIVRYLERLGVEYVFGVPGGSIEPFFNALARSERRGGIRAVIARHEAGAAFMAEGYARATGKLGVCCSTAGPGATNMITGVASAFSDGIPLLVISAQTSLDRFGQGSLQESSCTSVNTVEMFSRCTQYNTLVSHSAQLEPKLLHAISSALGNQPGPAHLGVPLDIMRQAASSDASGFNLRAFTDHEVAPSDHSINALATELASVSRVTVVLGEGAAKAAKTLIALAESRGWRLVTTPRGKGLIDSFHPLYCGVFGFAGHEAAAEALQSENAERVLVVGTALDEVSTCGWDTNTILSERLIHLASNPHHLIRSTMARLAILGAPELTLAALRERMETPDKPTVFTESDRQPDALPAYISPGQDPKCQTSTGVIKPQAMMTHFSRICHRDTQVLMDSGNSFLWGIHYWNSRRHNDQSSINRFHIGMGFASMGWAIGASVGVARASGTEPVICFTGDGSFLMAGQEITTALQENLNLLMIVLNDSALGMVRHGQKLSGGEPIGNRLPSIRYADVATAMGIESYRIETMEELLSLDLEGIFSRPGPCLIDAVIDGEEVPPMGSRLKVLTGAV